MRILSKVRERFTRLASIGCHLPLIQLDFVKALSSVSLAVVCLVLLVASQTKAQVPTLEGETFQNADLKNSRVVCDFRASRIDFSVQGVAIGPYPGTFTESGFLTFDPISGLITGGEITFNVRNETGTLVTGKKGPRDGKAFCTLDTSTGVTTIVATVPTLDYAADIEGSPDSGRATLDLFASIDKYVGLTTLQFQRPEH